MLNSLVSYSLIKSIYDQESKDYLDTFIPFLLMSFPKDQLECSMKILPKLICEKFGLKIPQHALNSIITRSIRKGYISRKSNICYLNEEGVKITSDILININNINRQVNATIEDIRRFMLNNYSINVPKERILRSLVVFLKKHQETLLSYFIPQLLQDTKEINDHSDKLERYLLEYLKIADQQKPEAFNTLKQIFYGAIISTIINKENVNEANKGFGKLQIFLDSNFMFSLMDLHYPDICKPAKELFALLKKNKFKINVFDFTIEEMVRVLRVYTSNKQKFIPGIRVDTIYSSLRNIGWNDSDCIHFISRIELKISEMGIDIVNTDFDLSKFEIDKELYSKLSQYKKEQNIFGQKHDILAIEELKRIRKNRPQRQIENCIAFFLTSDQKLARFNLIEMEHRQNSTVSEVVSDRVLTTLLWLKNPEWSKDLPWEVIVSAQSELLIHREVWEKFHENLIRLKEQSKITDEDISTLIYHYQRESELSAISNPEEVTDEFTLSEIEKSKKRISQHIHKKILEQKVKLEKRQIREIEQNNKEILDKIEAIKNKIKQESLRKAKVKAYLVVFACIVSIIVAVYFIKVDNALFIFALLPFLGFELNIMKIKDNLLSSFFKKSYENKLIEFDLSSEKQ